MSIVKFLCDNHLHCRECLSHCRNMETSPGRVFEGSHSPPLAPGQAQLCQIIPGRGRSNLPLRYPFCQCPPSPQLTASLEDSQPWCYVVWNLLFNISTPCGTFLRPFLLILWSMVCRTVLQMPKLLSHFSSAFSCLRAPVFPIFPPRLWTLGLYLSASAPVPSFLKHSWDLVTSYSKGRLCLPHNSFAHPTVNVHCHGSATSST